MTFLARFRRAPRADPRQGETFRVPRAGRQGELRDLHARLARCEEARAAAEEARAVAVEKKRTFRHLWMDARSQIIDLVIELEKRDRTIAELEAELAPYKGHVG